MTESLPWAQGGPQAAPQAKSGRVLRALVVDDQPGVRSLLQEVLALLGHDVQVADGGPAALALAMEQPFDVVFLDLRMPGLNGVEVMTYLQGLLPRALFVAITAYPDSELAHASLSAGACLCLPKPVSIGAIAHLLRDLEEERLEGGRR